jgi:hypothetical protein
VENGGLRFIVDITKNCYPLTRIDNTSNMLAREKCFANLNLKNSNYQDTIHSSYKQNSSLQHIPKAQPQGGSHTVLYGVVLSGRCYLRYIVSLEVSARRQKLTNVDAICRRYSPRDIF